MRWQAMAVLFLSLLMGSCNKIFMDPKARISLPDSIYTEFQSYTDSHRLVLYSPTARTSANLLVNQQVYSGVQFKEFDQKEYMHRAMIYRKISGDSLLVLLCPKGQPYSQAMELPYTLHQNLVVPERMGLTNVVAPVGIGVAAAIGLSQGSIGSGLGMGLGVLVTAAYQDLVGYFYGELGNPNAYWIPAGISTRSFSIAQHDSLLVSSDSVLASPVVLPQAPIAFQNLERIKKSRAWVRPQLWVGAEYPVVSFRNAELPVQGYGYPYRPGMHMQYGYSKSWREKRDWATYLGFEQGMLMRVHWKPFQGVRGAQHGFLASGPVWRFEGGVQRPYLLRLGLSMQLNYFIGWRSKNIGDWMNVPNGVVDTLFQSANELRLKRTVFEYPTERVTLNPRLDVSYEQHLSERSSWGISLSAQVYSGDLAYSLYEETYSYSPFGTSYSSRHLNSTFNQVTRYAVLSAGLRYIYHLNIHK